MTNELKPRIPILFFADEILRVQPYDWQCRILLNYEAGHPTAAAAANFRGKTSTESGSSLRLRTILGQVLFTRNAFFLGWVRLATSQRTK
jgi:hypothetical protein